jgi:hypothetical protein
MSAEARDEVAFRKMLFSALVILAGCTGAWFLLTSGRSREERRSLSATGTAPRFTVRLLEFPESPENRAKAARLAQSDSVKALAGAHDLQLVPLSGGRVVLCVGRFDSQDSPELRRLLGDFQAFADRGRKPFPEAAILSFPR